MGNLAKRTLTGIVLVLGIIVATFWNYYSFIVLILIVNLLSLIEFYRLVHTKNILPAKLAGGILSAIIIISFAIAIGCKSDWQILLINIPLSFGIFIIELYRRATHPFYNLAFTFLGLFCISIPLCFFIGIAFLSGAAGVYKYPVVIGYFLILWANDTWAFFIGRKFGRHPLFKRISPGKSWEGTIAGVLFALFAAYLNGQYFIVLRTNEWITLALIAIVTGTFGDLIKSLLKRSLGVKDSGTILPGHGGMLDRFDSLLGSAPFVFIYLILLKHG